MFEVQPFMVRQAHHERLNLTAVTLPGGGNAGVSPAEGG